MVRLYLAGNSAAKAAASVGCVKATCLRELKRLGITRRTLSEAGRKYIVDETFFDVIDTEEKAYWLGFLTADGSLYDDNTISLWLVRKDRRHLSKFKRALKSKHPIHDLTVTYKGKKYPQSRIQIYSRQLYKSLQKCGVVPRKTFTCRPFDVPTYLVYHYWRGLVDGDGCIGCYSSWEISLAGTKRICEGFRAWVCKFAKSKAKVRKLANTKCYKVSFNGNRLAPTILEKLYANSNVWLNRKHKLALLSMKVKP